MVTSRASKNLQAQTVCKKRKSLDSTCGALHFSKGKNELWGLKSLGRDTGAQCFLITFVNCDDSCIFCEYSICKWEKMFYLLTCILKAQQLGFLCARCQCALILQAVGIKASLYQRAVTRVTPLMHVEIWYCSDKDPVNIYTDKQAHGNFALLA